MSGPNEEQRRRPGGTGEDMDPDVDPSTGTPPIGDDAQAGQTESPAESGDVGVPDDIPDRTD